MAFLLGALLSAGFLAALAYRGCGLQRVVLLLSGVPGWLDFFLTRCMVENLGS